jgi:hypothetical protein
MCPPVRKADTQVGPYTVLSADAARAGVLAIRPDLMVKNRIGNRLAVTDD